MTEEGTGNVLRLTPRRQPFSTEHPAGPSRRIGSALLVNELRTPLAAVVRTLQRLSLQRLTVDDEPAPAATHLIRRARGLAAELQGVVDELLHVTRPEGVPTLRSHQESLSIQELMGLVGSVVSSYLEPDRLVVHCPDDLTITTHPGRLCELMVNLLAVATRHGGDAPVTIDAAVSEHDLDLVVRWSADPVHSESHDSDGDGDGDGDEGVGLPLARTLTQSLGGSLEVTTTSGETTVRVLLPQQRDRDRRHDAGNGPARTAG